MADIYLHQIYYDAASKGNLLPRFIPLDNAKNDRPDGFVEGDASIMVCAVVWE